MRRRTLVWAGVGGVLVLGVPGVVRAQHAEHEEASVRHAVAVLAPTAGSTVHGTVRFDVVDGGVRIMAQLEGLVAGEHGFHIHELGDCSAADGTSAGGHFNPAGMAHAGPDVTERHVGDLGNLAADTQGMATYDRTDGMIRLEGPHSIIGRGIIVHAGRDDLTSQPTGAAGGRVACGVIGVGR